MGGYSARGLGFGKAGIVVGVAANANYIDDAGTGTYDGLSLRSLPSVSTFRSGIDVLGTVRGRLGLVFDQILI